MSGASRARPSAAAALCIAVATAVGTGCAATPAPAPKRAPAPRATPLPPDIVARSALPLQLELDGRPGSLEELTPELARASALCIGESHDNPHHHFAQWELSRALARQASGRPFALGFEMFERAFQPALERYKEDGDAAELVRASEFEQRWGHAFPYYAPLLDSGRRAGADLLALNASRELSKAVAKSGPAGLSKALQRELPELDAEDAEHRAFFERAMGMTFEAASHGAGEQTATHGGHSGLSLENLYQAQLVWDETMAETASRWLEAHPNGLLLIIAGAGHCHESAIPRRIERRGPYQVLSARALLRSELGINDAPADSAFELLVILENTPIVLSHAEAHQTTGSEM